MILEQFAKLGLSEKTLKILEKKGFEEPTEIQAKTIPILLHENIDVIGQAQTGTGKTAAFGLPIIEKLVRRDQTTQALILTPTRELAIQVAEEINSFNAKKRLQIVPVYGGQSIVQQLDKLKKGVDVIVGTPGRILDHIKRKSINLKELTYVVLDEADEMLNMGFIDEVEEILSHTNENRKTLLFSATMPDRIMQVAKKYMNEYKIISVKKNTLTVDLTDQIYFEVANADKFEALCRIIDVESEFYGLIFCRTKVGVDELTNKLIDRGYDADGIHGDLSQFQRERILEKLKKRRLSILCATDVAARGIDIDNLTHVINYSLPQDPEAYVHRIGRTGRAGKRGIAITFISPTEYKKLQFISKSAKTDIRKESLPHGKDIVTVKMKRLYEELADIIDSNTHEEFKDIANTLLQKHDSEDLIAALLKAAYKEEFDETRYRDLQDVTVDKKGKTRLFVSIGKKDGLSAKKLVSLINNKTKIPSSKISEVKVMDAFSFLSVPFKEAELILFAFNNKDDNGPVVQKANKPKESEKKKSNRKDYKRSGKPKRKK